MTSVKFRSESRGSRKRPDFPELDDNSKRLCPIGARIFPSSQLVWTWH
jgi:succinate dehydrogenase/fumarate reductase flavoprotein subunit